MPAIIGGSLAAGGALLGGLMGSSASKKAANQQYDATMQGLRIQQAMYNQGRDDTAPWREVGKDSLYSLRDMLQPGGYLRQEYSPAEYTGDAGFKFGLDTGRQAIEQSAAARGVLGSGKTLKDIMQYGTDYGTTKYNEGWQRNMSGKQFLQQALAGLSGTGAATSGQSAQLGANAGASMADLLGSGAAARAAGIVGSANALSSGINNATNSYMTYSLLNRFMPQGTTQQANYLDPGTLSALTNSATMYNAGYAGQPDLYPY